MEIIVVFTYSKKHYRELLDPQKTKGMEGGIEVTGSMSEKEGGDNEAYWINKYENIK